MAFRIVTPVVRTEPHPATEQAAVSVDALSDALAHASEPTPPEPTPPEPDHNGDLAIYTGSVRVLDHNTGARTGRTAHLQLIEPVDALLHPFKGLRWSSSRAAAAHELRGQRMRIVFSQPATEDGDEDTTLYIGEGMLTWWSDDCANGMRIKLRFDVGPDGADWHPLTGTHADAKNGDVIYLACWAVADDEEVQDPRDARRASKPFTSLTAVRQSQIKCRLDERFQSWCAAERAELLAPDAAEALPDFAVSRTAFAEAVVRAFCNVASRSVFSQDTAAGFAARQRWQDMLRRYEAWRHLPSG